MITIVTDSTADLSPELIERFGIVVVPLQVNHSGKSYLDGITIHTPELFQIVEESGVLPTTSAPSVGAFAEVFSQSGDIIYIGISTELSSTVHDATIAAEETAPGRVQVIDSLNLSTGIGLLALKAAELRDAGLTAAQITDDVRRAVARVRTSFVIETMDYLYKGGRCSSLQHLVGSLFKIRPVIEVKPDGKMGVKDKLRGTRRKALDALLEDLEKQRQQIEMHRIFVTHTGCDADAAYLVQAIHLGYPFDEVCVTTAGSVVASHCGPDTIGILYFIK